MPPNKSLPPVARLCPPRWRHVSVLGLCLALWGMSGGCPPTPPEPKTISLTIRPSPGCGLCEPYNLDCIDGIEIRATPQNGAPGQLGKKCMSRDELHVSSLCDLKHGNGQELLGNLDLSQPMYLEIRGYHGLVEGAGHRGTEEVCSSLSYSDRMFWGRSQTVSLGEGGESNVLVDLECRARCPCSDMGKPGCPQRMPTSACVPINQEHAQSVGCHRLCNDNSDCFGGLLSCQETLERNKDGGVINRCVPVHGEPFCQECDADDPCPAGTLCVFSKNAPSVGELTGRCLPSCPKGDSAHPLCELGTWCLSLVGWGFELLQ